MRTLDIAGGFFRSQEFSGCGKMERFRQEAKHDSIRIFIQMNRTKNDISFLPRKILCSGIA